MLISDIFMITSKKTISFVVHYPYQWYIYRPIWRYIDWAVCEVIIDLRPFTVPLPGQVQEDIERLLNDEGINYRVLNFTDYFNTNKLTEFFADVEVLVSCWERGCMGIPETAHLKKVNTTYGIAKELTLVRPTRSICDLILAYGPRDQAYFSLLTKSVSVGNPRFDDFYNGINTVPPELQSLGGSRPILLYAPGHGDLGSLASLYAVFRDQITVHFTVLLKPHYFTLRDESELIGQYAQLPNLTVIDDGVDLIGVIALADVVLTDTSSLIFDALQARKPLLVTDFLTTEYLNIHHKVLRQLPRGFSGASTYSDSLEQVCKREGKIRTIAAPQELLVTLQGYKRWHTELRQVQTELVEELFAYTDGTSGQRAANEIETLFKTERDHRPGILAHAYQAYHNRYSALLLNMQSTKAEVPIPQVVVIDDVSASKEERVRSVESAQAMTDRVLFLSQSEDVTVSVPVVSSLSAVREWIIPEQNIVFVGVGVVVPAFKLAWVPNKFNRIHFFGGGDILSPLNKIKQSILGIRLEDGLFLNETTFRITKPNHFCTDIQAVLMSGQFFREYYLRDNVSDFRQLPLEIYRQFSLVATFRLFPFLLDYVRSDDGYIEQQMRLYGLFANEHGLQVWDCQDLKIGWLMKLFISDRKTLRLAVIKMNAMLLGR